MQLLDNQLAYRQLLDNQLVYRQLLDNQLVYRQLLDNQLVYRQLLDSQLVYTSVTAAGIFVIIIAFYYHCLFLFVCIRGSSYTEVFR